MYIAKPLTIGSNLLLEIQRFGLIDESPSPFELRRLKRDAEKLLQVSALESYVVQAAISALTWDAEAVDLNSAKALRLGSDAVTLYNCALSKRFVGDISGAADLMAEAAQRHPLDLDLIESAVDLLVSAGRLSIAAKICQGSIRRLLPVPAYAESTILLAEKSEKLGVTDEMMTEQAEFAFDVLAKHQRRMRAYDLRVSRDPDGTEVLVCTVKFSGTAVDEMRMESELAAKLSDLSDWDPCVFAMELSAVPLQHADLAV